MKNICHWIIIESKRILLIKRSKDKRNFANFWAFPWWWQELNETPEETTIREVKEEVWLDFEIERLFSQKIEEERWLFVDYLWKAKGIIN
jgi:ADP-ribose pyrophosphatase YjhB (NUDIX family)